jgi:hypothetical protein
MTKSNSKTRVNPTSTLANSSSSTKTNSLQLVASRRKSKNRKVRRSTSGKPLDNSTSTLTVVKPNLERKCPVKIIVCPPFLLLYCKESGEIRPIRLDNVREAYDIHMFFSEEGDRYIRSYAPTLPKHLVSWMMLTVEEQAMIRSYLQGSAQNYHKLEELQRRDRNYHEALAAISPDNYQGQGRDSRHTTKKRSKHNRHKKIKRSTLAKARGPHPAVRAFVVFAGNYGSVT